MGFVLCRLAHEMNAWCLVLSLGMAFCIAARVDLVDILNIPLECLGTSFALKNPN